MKLKPSLHWLWTDLRQKLLSPLLPKIAVFPRIAVASYFFQSIVINKQLKQHHANWYSVVISFVALKYLSDIATGCIVLQLNRLDNMAFASHLSWISFYHLLYPHPRRQCQSPHAGSVRPHWMTCSSVNAGISSLCAHGTVHMRTTSVPAFKTDWLIPVLWGQ